MTNYGDILWQPSKERIETSQMARFAQLASERSGQDLGEFNALYAWSIQAPRDFWDLVQKFAGIIWQKPPDKIYSPPPPTKLRGAKWFQGGCLNYAENLLHGASSDAKIVAYAEGGAKRSIKVPTLQSEVARVAHALREIGVMPGDRVAGVLVNSLEAIIAMLGATAVGAIWASCSPDFGAPAIVDRFGQIGPKVVFFTSHYIYAGKRCDCLAQIQQALQGLPTVEKAVIVSHLEPGVADSVAKGVPRACTWHDFLSREPGLLRFAPRQFDDPLYILFSSGTTGAPKCIIHSVGGTLLQHVKELRLHSDIGIGSKLLFYTTCGWMMWNWMVSALAAEASLVLFEGAVTSPDLGVLWRTLQEEKVTAFGTSPKFIQSCMAQKVHPKSELGSWRPRTLMTTGSPLLPEQFAWIYQEVGQGGDLHLASISGGTDIISCFMLGTPLLPVRAGEIQYAGLGMAIDAWDDQGRSIRGQKGELVCKTPFPSMPVGFWGDQSGERYQKAYFAHFQTTQEVWRHGDYVEITPRGGVIVYGRSDATLNPGGVRIGTAELYRQVEEVEEIADAVAVGHRAGGDERIILFVKLKSGFYFSDELVARVKKLIRSRLTPRHVPSQVLQVRDIPYTRSGKKVEIAVAQSIHGEEVPNKAALVNPECLEEFSRLGTGLRSN